MIENDQGQHFSSNLVGPPNNHKESLAYPETYTFLYIKSELPRVQDVQDTDSIKHQTPKLSKTAIICYY